MLPKRFKELDTFPSNVETYASGKDSDIYSSTEQSVSATLTDDARYSNTSPELWTQSVDLQNESNTYDSTSDPESTDLCTFSNDSTQLIDVSSVKAELAVPQCEGSMETKEVTHPPRLISTLKNQQDISCGQTHSAHAVESLDASDGIYPHKTSQPISELMVLNYHSDIARITSPILHASAPKSMKELQSRRVMLTNLPENISYPQLLRGVRRYVVENIASILPRKTSAQGRQRSANECALLEFSYVKDTNTFVSKCQAQPLCYRDEQGAIKQALVRIVPTTSYDKPWNFQAPKEAERVLNIYGFPNTALWFFIFSIGVRGITLLHSEEATGMLHVEFMTSSHRIKAQKLLNSLSKVESVFANVSSSYGHRWTDYDIENGPVDFIRADSLKFEFDCPPFNQWWPSGRGGTGSTPSPSDESDSQGKETPIGGTAQSNIDSGNASVQNVSPTVKQNAYFIEAGIKDITNWDRYGQMARHRTSLQHDEHVGCDKICCNIKTAPVPQVIQDFFKPMGI